MFGKPTPVPQGSLHLVIDRFIPGSEGRNDNGHGSFVLIGRVSLARIPSVEGRVNAPPEDSSVHRGRRSSCLKFT